MSTEAASRKQPAEGRVDHCMSESTDINGTLKSSRKQNVKDVIRKVLEKPDDPKWKDFLQHISYVLYSGLNESSVSLGMPSSVRGELQKKTTT